jgi:hypothetical protein
MTTNDIINITVACLIVVSIGKFSKFLAPESAGAELIIFIVLMALAVLIVYLIPGV